MEWLSGWWTPKRLSVLLEFWPTMRVKDCKGENGEKKFQSTRQSGTRFKMFKGLLYHVVSRFTQRRRDEVSKGPTFLLAPTGQGGNPFGIGHCANFHWHCQIELLLEVEDYFHGIQNWRWCGPQLPRTLFASGRMWTRDLEIGKDHSSLLERFPMSTSCLGRV
jgi:hypothetical protein